MAYHAPIGIISVFLSQGYCYSYAETHKIRSQVNLLNSYIKQSSVASEHIGTVDILTPIESAPTKIMVTSIRNFGTYSILVACARKIDRVYISNSSFHGIAGTIISRLITHSLDTKRTLMEYIETDVKQIEFKDLSTRGLSYGILHDVLVLVASRYLQVLLIEKALPDSYRDSTTVVRVYETVALALALFIFSPLDLIKIGRQIDIFENPEKPPCPFSSSPIATLLKERKNKGILGLWLNSAAVWKTVCACSSILVLSLTYRGLVGLTERYLLKSQ
eukprot:TRINITY_DN793_c0_g1_i1.p1 TRINITY_DN793_c0_g1~~TRINITY_DN793_c0_g1_i1.p1  ORF type:complete len:276 (-),score=87.37 TRINITY_DN793_c0_g1_i1:38-865(-)